MKSIVPADGWPRPDTSTLEKAARAALLAEDGVIEADITDAMVRDVLVEPAFQATVAAVWADRIPTPDAYAAACRALEKHRERANEAEARLAKVRVLSEAARSAIGVGCLARDYEMETCEGRCGGHRTTGWTLDPTEVLAVLDNHGGNDV